MKNKKEIQNFALILGLLFVLYSLYTLYTEHVVHWSIFPGTIILMLGLFAPLWLSIPYKWWMKLANLLSRMMTTFILTIIFFILLTPIAIVARMLGKQFLDLNISSEAKSYWQWGNKKQIEHQTDLENQF